ncbi:hypothetical protein C7H19_24235 [Aphanothece hegewaldii CCALA 016]|uniref:Zorya protein ZorC EH domain-containing protein n=1 Tax=Aphanothece hegewaldii CCALA 016 TaxID=2107694 RepID=A0A2T1LQR7_9CHRO|nr:EH signature domain-containing protein [Aphanothece hegewaldii]PSF29689.1 hypothetical protein C7H19_24235 [Aphanothece hegewaldii CCALA 016]
MSYSFRVLSLKDPTVNFPSKVNQLSKHLFNSKIGKSVFKLLNEQEENFRTYDEIIQEIYHNNAHKIKPLEWIYCLYNQTEWELMSLDERNITSQKIWRFALENLWLKRLLLWLMVLEYSSPQLIISPELVQNFSTFADQAPEKEHITIQIIQAIADENYLNLTQLSIQSLLTPWELLQQKQLPSTIPALRQANYPFVEVFAQNHKPEWLLNCFKQISFEQQNHQIEQLLTTIPVSKVSSFSSIVTWLRQSYGPRTPQSKWHQLSANAQAALLKCLNTSTWSDFQALVNVLLQQLNSSLAQSKYGSRKSNELNSQINQLRRRRDFWSNYSDNFERLRILLPLESQNWISDQLKRDIDILISDNSDPTEVCIFDFGDYFVIEFFRGAGSEMRLFNRYHYPDIESKLFTSAELSLKQLRCLGGEVHDHMYLWQGSAEQLLRKNGITPNENTKTFKGLDSRHNRYNFTTGLPKPSSEKITERERNLTAWRRKIKELDEEARHYCSMQKE